MSSRPRDESRKGFKSAGSAERRESRILTQTHAPEVAEGANEPCWFAVLKMLSHPFCESHGFVLPRPGEEGHAEEGIAF